MLALPEGTVLYNDFFTNHITRPKGCEDAVTRVPNAAAASSFVYDEYTKSMWHVGAAGQLYNVGRELTLKDYREHWSAYNNNHNKDCSSC